MLLLLVLRIIVAAWQFLDAVVSIPFTQIKIGRKLTLAEKRILDKYSAFYRQLDSVGKREFEKRLNYFLLHKKFIQRGKVKITEEMKLLIAATAVQLTFGLRRTFFYRFPNIFIYPAKYLSKHTRKYHKGEVNAAGAIVLSWADFMEGIKDTGDGVNLGLHEFAHALKIEDATHDVEYGLIDFAALRKWHKVSRIEILKLRRGEIDYLREYAATNEEEFFAVCVEKFFEQPEDFYKNAPELYKALSELLNQDTAKALPVAG